MIIMSGKKRKTNNKPASKYQKTINNQPQKQGEQHKEHNEAFAATGDNQQARTSTNNSLDIRIKDLTDSKQG